MDVSKIKDIKEVKDEKIKSDYNKKVTELSKKTKDIQIKDVFIIKTEEDFKYEID